MVEPSSSVTSNSTNIQIRRIGFLTQSATKNDINTQLLQRQIENEEPNSAFRIPVKIEEEETTVRIKPEFFDSFERITIKKEEDEREYCYFSDTENEESYSDNSECDCLDCITRDVILIEADEEYENSLQKRQMVNAKVEMPVSELPPHLIGCQRVLRLKPQHQFTNQIGEGSLNHRSRQQPRQRLKKLFRCKWESCGLTFTSRQTGFIHVRIRHLNVAATFYLQKQSKNMEPQKPSQFLEEEIGSNSPLYFTTTQEEQMKEIFTRFPKLNFYQRENLVFSMQICESRIVAWFQNRRNKAAYHRKKNTVNHDEQISLPFDLSQASQSTTELSVTCISKPTTVKNQLLTSFVTSNSTSVFASSTETTYNVVSSVASEDHPLISTPETSSITQINDIRKPENNCRVLIKIINFLITKDNNFAYGTSRKNIGNVKVPLPVIAKHGSIEYASSTESIRISDTSQTGVNKNISESSHATKANEHQRKESAIQLRSPTPPPLSASQLFQIRPSASTISSTTIDTESFDVRTDGYNSDLKCKVTEDSKRYSVNSLKKSQQQPSGVIANINSVHICSVPFTDSNKSLLEAVGKPASPQITADCLNTIGIVNAINQPSDDSDSLSNDSDSYEVIDSISFRDETISSKETFVTGKCSKEARSNIFSRTKEKNALTVPALKKKSSLLNNCSTHLSQVISSCKTRRESSSLSNSFGRHLAFNELTKKESTSIERNNIYAPTISQLNSCSIKSGKSKRFELNELLRSKSSFGGSKNASAQSLNSNVPSSKLKSKVEIVKSASKGTNRQSNSSKRQLVNQFDLSINLSSNNSSLASSKKPRTDMLNVKSNTNSRRIFPNAHHTNELPTAQIGSDESCFHSNLRINLTDDIQQRPAKCSHTGPLHGQKIIQWKIGYKIPRKSIVLKEPVPSFVNSSDVISDNTDTHICRFFRADHKKETRR